jgi:hypothetical protein
MANHISHNKTVLKIYLFKVDVKTIEGYNANIFLWELELHLKKTLGKQN